MTDFIYAAVMPQLLEVKGMDPDKALADFRENQYRLLKKYGCIPTSKFYIDFDGEIYSLT
jgi:hypothetical protein